MVYVSIGRSFQSPQQQRNVCKYIKPLKIGSFAFLSFYFILCYNQNMKNADNRDLRISVDVRKKTDYLQPLFNTEDPPVVFHRAADELAHILNISYETEKY